MFNYCLAIFIDLEVGGGLCIRKSLDFAFVSRLIRFMLGLILGGLFVLLSLLKMLSDVCSHVPQQGMPILDILFCFSAYEGLIFSVIVPFISSVILLKFLIKLAFM